MPGTLHRREQGGGLRIQGELSSFDIARLADIYKPRYMVWRTSGPLLNHDGGNTVELFWTSLGDLTITSSCYCLTLKTSMFRKTEKGCSLSALAGERRPEIFRIRERKRKLLKE